MTSIISLCLISVYRADNLADLATCERDVGNCEQFSFRRAQENVSNVNNNSSSQKGLKSIAMKDLGVVEKQIVLEQTDIQENGNFNTTNCTYHTVPSEFIRQMNGKLRRLNPIIRNNLIVKIAQINTQKQKQNNWSYTYCDNFRKNT